jgi:hypothetical protein
MATPEEKEAVYKDALNKYYRLKTEYEENINKEKRKISSKKHTSVREKRIEFTKLKPKCVNCKRSVGSVFSNKSDGDNRRLLAMCGDRTSPCPLNIEIYLGNINDLTELMKDDEKEISKLKKEIIIHKNDVLFGYITSEDAVAKFDNIKESINESMKSREYLTTLYLNIIDNPEKRETMKRLQTELYNDIDNIKKMMTEYEKSQNVQYVHDAVELYVNNILSKNEEMLLNKYTYCNIEVESTNYENIYTLIQKPYSYEDLEYDLAEKEHYVAHY